LALTYDYKGARLQLSGHHLLSPGQNGRGDSGV
jgi:hypothetical protein